MSIKVEDKGHYELFETTNGNHILVLNDERWFAWVEGQQGEILVYRLRPREGPYDPRRAVLPGRLRGRPQVPG